MTMGQTNLDGTLVAGPVAASDNTFPSGVSDITIHTATYPKSWNACTGAKKRSVNATIGGGTWVTLSGVGTGDDVEEADFLYLRCDSTLLVELTQKLAVGTLVATRYVQGPMMLQCPPGNPIVLVRVQGSATLEYHAEGQR